MSDKPRKLPWWAWWLIMLAAPLWIPLAGVFALVVMVCMAVLVVVAGVIDGLARIINVEPPKWVNHIVP